MTKPRMTAGLLALVASLAARAPAGAAPPSDVEQGSKPIVIPGLG